MEEAVFDHCGPSRQILLFGYLFPMLHRCVVIEKKKNRYILSLRPSRMGDDVTATDLEVTSLTDVTEGAIMRGFVKASSKHGIFVWYVCVPTHVHGHTHHTHHIHHTPHTHHIHARAHTHTHTHM